jgi:hypothetical protein
MKQKVLAALRKLGTNHQMAIEVIATSVDFHLLVSVPGLFAMSGTEGKCLFAVGMLFVVKGLSALTSDKTFETEEDCVVLFFAGILCPADVTVPLLSAMCFSFNLKFPA